VYIVHLRLDVGDELPASIPLDRRQVLAENSVAS
jgi:hypothetical protein